MKKVFLSSGTLAAGIENALVAPVEDPTAVIPTTVTELPDGSIDDVNELASNALIDQQDKKLAEIASLESMLDSLETLKYMKGPISSLENYALIGQVAQNAVEGTDLVAEDIIPHPDVVVPDLSENIPVEFDKSAIEIVSQEAFDNFKAKVSAFGTWVWEMLMKLFNLFRSKTGRVEKARKAFQEATDAKKVIITDTVDLTGNQKAYIGRANDLNALYSNVNKVVKEGESVITDMVVKLLADISKTSSGKTDEEVLDGFGDLEVSIDEFISTVTGAFKTTKSNEDGVEKTTVSLTGDATIVLTKRPSTMTYQSKIELNDTDGGSMPTLTAVEINAFLNTIQEVEADTSKWEEALLKGQLKAQTTLLFNKIENLPVTERGKISSVISGVINATIRTIVLILTATNAASEAHLRYVEKSLGNYGVKKD